MKNMIQEMLDEQQDPATALRLALRREACFIAKHLGESPGGSGARVAWRLYLIQTLEACKQYVNESFWRAVLSDVRDLLTDAPVEAPLPVGDIREVA